MAVTPRSPVLTRCTNAVMLAAPIPRVPASPAPVTRRRGKHRLAVSVTDSHSSGVYPSPREGRYLVIWSDSRGGASWGAAARAS